MEVGRSCTDSNPGLAAPGLPTLLPTPVPAHGDAGVSKVAAGQRRWIGYLCKPREPGLIMQPWKAAIL